ncbi:DNA cytosine methyltransferase [Actinoalloteichus fjordicus]|uniref:DNA (cytosine-5-)-methyltransferase n=1 Tax=Actinoalloteichus fjordicus TaxID=1612552 RepID=A0AAC9LC88_9PSEU|nr:DNA cytosine methyltransferase [Actinoalloteichus fjordicus]APU15303.1 C-5 cytosine-specific DNA methylase [Actinoalloteichus fjordicus]
MVTAPDLKHVDTRPVIGSLCTGTGALDLGVLAALGGGRVAWCADPDPHVRSILAARMPGIPNFGDLRAVDWARVEPVDLVTVGFPCQDISAAGRRAGIREGTRSGLWTSIMAALRLLRPAYILVENVAALRWRHGGLDTVLADLAQAGFDALWRSVRASDVGAPHRRERVFLLAWQKPDTSGSSIKTSSRFWSGPNTPICQQHGTAGGEPQGRGYELIRSSTWLPTALAGIFPNDGEITDHNVVHHPPDGIDSFSKPLSTAVPRLPPRIAADSPQDLSTFALLPTPRATEGSKGSPNQRGSKGDLTLSSTIVRLPAGDADRHPASKVDWRDYASAIRRWEQVLDRPPPPPTEPGRNGRRRLAPEFVEWTMGLPPGWITDLGLPRVAQLRALGNAVVPHQAAWAIRLLLDELGAHTVRSTWARPPQRPCEREPSSPCSSSPSRSL